MICKQMDRVGKQKVVNTFYEKQSTVFQKSFFLNYTAFLILLQNIRFFANYHSKHKLTSPKFSKLSKISSKDCLRKSESNSCQITLFNHPSGNIFSPFKSSKECKHAFIQLMSNVLTLFIYLLQLLQQFSSIFPHRLTTSATFPRIIENTHLLLKVLLRINAYCAVHKKQG